MDNKLTKITGLFLNEKDGKKYFSGKDKDGRKWFVFKNIFKKEGSKEPDYNLFVENTQVEPLNNYSNQETPF